HAHHARAAPEGCRRRAGARGREGGGLEWGNAHRREPARAQPPLGATHGAERDDPARLAREMATLRRSCRRLIWLDPLAGRPGFEPTTQGLVAALPYVDEFVACANVASLAHLAERLHEAVA